MARKRDKIVSLAASRETDHSYGITISEKSVHISLWSAWIVTPLAYESKFGDAGSRESKNDGGHCVRFYEFVVSPEDFGRRHEVFSILQCVFITIHGSPCVGNSASRLA